MQTDDLPTETEPAGTILVGSQHKRAYLYVCQSAERMAIERENARLHGVQDMREFVFVLDGQRFELTFDDLKRRLIGPPCIECGGVVKASQGGICMACVGESSDSAEARHAK